MSQVLWSASARTAHAEPTRTGPPAAEAMLHALLDEVDYPLVVLDGDGAVTLHNHAARVISSHGRSPWMVDGRDLVVLDAGDRSRLTAAVQEAAARSRRSMLLFGREPNQHCVAVTPVDCQGVRLVLVVGERGRICEELSLHSFARAQGITEAEARVLAALSKGDSPARIADEQGVALCTVRTQLKSLRSKLGSSTTRELVRRVSRLPPLVNALRRVLPS